MCFSKAIKLFGTAACAVFIVLASAVCQAGVIGPELEKLLPSLGSQEEVSVIVTLADRVDVTKFKEKDKDRRRIGLIQSLLQKAEETQGPLKGFLKDHGIREVSSLWIINGLTLKARPALIQRLAKRPDVDRVELDKKIQAPVISSGLPGPAEWNISQIRAPEIWGMGYTGAGTVVAAMDTGVDVDHPDLADRWRGGENSWFDPYGEHLSPYDKTGHGTQVMGVMVGGSYGGTAIGVAPDALWIAVKVFNDSGLASFSAIHQGFQWLLDPDGNPLTDDAPDVVNNSWGFEQNPNQCITEFQSDVQILKTAGIAVVFSAGNAGPFSYTSISPANYPESFAAGAVDASGIIDFFSSRGPSSCDGSIYPELVAPGVNIKAADLTLGGAFPGSYAYVSGTSFASPHVAGAMVLLMSAFPGVGVSDLENALLGSALDLGYAGADNVYGYGLLDVMAAYNILNTPLPCTDSDGDGYYAGAECGTAVDCDDDDGTVYPGAPEVKHDGIDQDCNGYDLTIDVIRADYQTKRDVLTVEATSDLGIEAALELLGYGPMKWNRKNAKWSISIRGAGGNPGIITVVGIEGWEKSSVIPK
jgi:serine protease AprX